MTEKKHFSVQKITHLTDSVFIIRIDKHDFMFAPGQHVTLGIKGAAINREYSVYSSPSEPYMEFLIKAYPDSESARLLQTATPGTELDLAGPYGKFSIPEHIIANKTPILFIASGVGIAPFHCFIKSFPSLNYKIIHGVSYANERYQHEEYPENLYTACLSKEIFSNCFHGQVTDYLKQNKIPDNTNCFICGNNRMVAEAYDILREQNISCNQIYTEVFF